MRSSTGWLPSRHQRLSLFWNKKTIEIAPGEDGAVGEVIALDTLVSLWDSIETQVMPDYRRRLTAIKTEAEKHGRKAAGFRSQAYELLLQVKPLKRQYPFADLDSDEEWLLSRNVIAGRESRRAAAAKANVAAALSSISQDFPQGPLGQQAKASFSKVNGLNQTNVRNWGNIRDFLDDFGKEQLLAAVEQLRYTQIDKRPMSLTLRTQGTEAWQVSF